jgi:elongation factor 1-alpha
MADRFGLRTALVTETMQAWSPAHVKRVVVCGPRSSGKTTIVKQLNNAYGAKKTVIDQTEDGELVEEHVFDLVLIEELPYEVHQHIMSFLPPTDLNTLSLLNSSFRDTINRDNTIWRNLSQSYGIKNTDLTEDLLNSKYCRWKKIFISDMLTAQSFRLNVDNKEILVSEARTLKQTNTVQDVTKFTSTLVQGHLPVLVLSALTAEQDIATKNGIANSIALAAYTVGMRQFVCVITHLDQVEKPLEIMHDIRITVRLSLIRLGYNDQRFAILPRDNQITTPMKPNYIVEPLISAMETFGNTLTNQQQPMISLVNTVTKVSDTYQVTAFVTTNTLSLGRVTVSGTTSCDATVHSIQILDTRAQVSSAEQAQVLVKLTPTRDNVLVSQRCVLTLDPEVKAQNKIRVQCIIVKDLDIKYKVGTRLLASVGMRSCWCTIFELVQKIDKRTGRVAEENPESVKHGDAVIMDILLDEPTIVSPFGNTRVLGVMILSPGLELEEFCALVAVVKSVEMVNL